MSKGGRRENPGGRPRIGELPRERMTIMLAVEIAAKIRRLAKVRHQSLSEVVNVELAAHWIRDGRNDWD